MRPPVSAARLVIARRPVAGIAAEDICAANAWLRRRAGIEPTQIICVGLGENGVAVLLAAALDKKIGAVAALHLGQTYAAGRDEPFLPNLLRYGDLPQIAALIAPRAMFLAGIDKEEFKMATSNKKLHLEAKVDANGQKFMSWLEVLWKQN